MEYGLILILLLFCSFNFDFCGRNRRRQFFFSLSLILLILLAGLRYRVGLDTIRYLCYFYIDDPVLSDLDIDSFLDSSYAPLYLVFVSFIKTFFGSFYFVQLFQSLIVNILLFYYFKRHTSYVFTCMLFYFMWIYLSLNTEEMKASISVVICLYANDYIIEKKFLKSVLLIILASQFHYSAYILLIAPLFAFLRFNKVGWTLLVISLLVGSYIQMEFGELMSLFSTVVSMEGHTDYTGKTLSSQVLNINGIISLMTTSVIYPYISFAYLKRRNENENLVSLEPILLLGMIFAVISIPVSLFYRFVRFYQPYFILFYAELLVCLARRIISSSRVTSYFISICYFVPVLFFINSDYFGRVKDTNIRVYSRYYPYYSIFSKRIDPQREKLFTYYPNTEYWNEDY